MSFFLHRHPSAPAKIKRYINRFEKIASEFQDNNLSYKANERQLNDKYKLLSHNFKHTQVSKSATSYRPPREQIFQMNPQSTFITGHISKPTSSILKKEFSPQIKQPRQCNPISKVMPIRPIYGAYKYYDSVAAQEMKMEENELMLEVNNYPQLELDYKIFAKKKKVDPYFHIGGFPKEMLIRSPDETVYTHVHSNPTFESTNDIINDYLQDPSKYYIKNDDDDYCIEKETDYYQYSENERSLESNKNENYIEQNNDNQYDENIIIEEEKPRNARRTISTR